MKSTAMASYRFILLLVCVLTVFSAVPTARGAEPLQPIEMYLGEVKTLPVSGVQRVAIGNGKIMTTNVLENEIVLLAEQAGRTTLLLWTTGGKQLGYDVRVTVADPADTARRVAQLVAGIPGIKVEQISGQVLVSGTASKPNLARVNAITRLFPGTLDVVREEEVTMRKTVFLKVSFIEVSKKVASNIGVAWDQVIAGPSAGVAGDLISNSTFRIPNTPPAGFPGTLPNPMTSLRAYFGITSAITSQINLALQNNEAWILATPELSTRSGGEAKFLAGGQVPVVTPASGLSPPTVTYKDFGVKLSIQPTADDRNNVNALIKTEMSTIDASTTVGGNPGFLTRSTDSEINVQSGQTIVLSGIVNSALAEAIQKVPFLGDIPVLGPLFRSTNFQNGRTDMLILVTPMVVDADSTINRERLEKAQEMQQNFQRRLGANGIVD
jgi:pilus assembly protein CpaC